MKPVQLAFAFESAPTRKWGRSMLARLAVLAAATAVLVAPVEALARSSYVIKGEIAELPFARALAYQKAANEWCFLDERMKAMGLGQAALAQGAYIGGGDKLIAEMEKAGDHLSRDQAACAPAIDFIKRTVNNLPALKAKLDTLGPEYERALADENAAREKQAAAEEEANKQAAAEAAAKAKKRAEEQAETMKAAKAAGCFALADAKTIPGDENPYAQIAVANARKNILDNCTGILTATQINEAIKVIADARARGERGAAAKKAEMDKVAAETIAKNKGKP